jgi:hypothetical protein
MPQLRHLLQSEREISFDMPAAAEDLDINHARIAVAYLFGIVLFLLIFCARASRASRDERGELSLIKWYGGRCWFRSC